MTLYADDSAMICNDQSIQNLKTTSEKEFRKVCNWLQLNELLYTTNNNCVVYTNNCTRKVNNFCIIITVITISKNTLR